MHANPLLERGAHMPWHTDLTDEQSHAASYTGHHARLLAGPGTGKTRTLIKRAVFLMEEQRVTAQDLLLLTFTRAAAAELRRRIEQQLAATSRPPLTCTLHSYALQCLIQSGEAVRLPHPLRIADDYEERWIIEEELKQLAGLSNVREARELLQAMSADWETLRADDTNWGDAFASPRFLGAWQEHREVYGYTLRAELVYQLKQALDEGAYAIDDCPDHVLIDEYQDLNPCDLAVVAGMAAIGATIYCAGDDDQSIYGFRHANPAGIRQFTAEYTGAADLRLEECHRCAEPILAYAEHVIDQDIRREPKNLVCVNPNDASRVALLAFCDGAAEATGIGELCEWLTHQGVEANQILILVRSDHSGVFSDGIVNAIRDLGLQVMRASHAAAPLDEGEGREFMCLLRLLVDRSDHLAWRTLLELRTNGVGQGALSAAYDLARRSGHRFADELMAIHADPSRLQRFGRPIAEEVSVIAALLDDAVQSCHALQPLPQVMLLGANWISDECVRDAVLNVFTGIAEQSPPSDLEGLLKSVGLSLGQHEQERDENAIAVMSMHQAKGLTADAVIVAAAEDEYLPGRAQGVEIDDERRLLYVSLTRATTYLFVTHASRRTGQQMRTGRTAGTPRRTLTRFLRSGPCPTQPGAPFLSALPR